MTHEQAQPFDENAALAELERLRQAIMAARRERQKKSDEFEAFVQGFRKPLPLPPVAERPVPASRVSAPVQKPGPPVVEQLPAPPLPPVAAPPQLDVIDEAVPVAPTETSRKARSRVRWPIVIGVTAGVIALGVLASRPRKQAPPPEPAAPVTDTRVASDPVETPTPPAPEPAGPVQEPARAVTLDLRTLQSVWMRVVIDGEKKSEGMVQGGESLHFGGDDSIVIRVGNGGAVVVKNGDREDAFGAADQPITRRFAKR